MDDKSKEELLGEVMDNVKPPKDNGASQSPPTSSQGSKNEGGSQSSSSQAAESGGDTDEISSKPEPISEVDADEVF